MTGQLPSALKQGARDIRFVLWTLLDPVVLIGAIFVTWIMYSEVRTWIPESIPNWAVTAIVVLGSLVSVAVIFRGFDLIIRAIVRRFQER